MPESLPLVGVLLSWGRHVAAKNGGRGLVSGNGLFRYMGCLLLVHVCQL